MPSPRSSTDRLAGVTDAARKALLSITARDEGLMSASEMDAAPELIRRRLLRWDDGWSEFVVTKKGQREAARLRSEVRHG